VDSEPKQVPGGATKSVFSLATSSSPSGAVLRAAVQGNVARLLGTAHKRVVVTSQPSGLRRLTQGDVRTHMNVSIPVLASSASYWALVSVLEHNTSLPFLKSHVDSGIVWYSTVRYEMAAKKSEPDADAWVVALAASLVVLAVAGAAVAAYLVFARAAAAPAGSGTEKVPLKREKREATPPTTMPKKAHAHRHRLPHILIVGDKRPLLSDF